MFGRIIVSPLTNRDSLNASNGVLSCSLPLHLGVLYPKKGVLSIFFQFFCFLGFFPDSRFLYLIYK